MHEIEFSDYIVFIDESGSPTLSNIDPDYPIFVLIFCVVNKKIYAEKIQPAIKMLKFKYFGHDLAVLHSHDIRKPKGEFSFLLRKEKRIDFLNDMNSVIAEAPVDIIAHIIDKRKLISKYTKPYDPYNIALRMSMEQLAIYLKQNHQTNKLVHLIAEGRGKNEDSALELEFHRIIDPNQAWGISHQFPVADMQYQLKFVEKKINSAGLQFADLTGHPIGRNYINPQQENRAYDIVKSKLWRRAWIFP